MPKSALLVAALSLVAAAGCRSGIERSMQQELPTIEAAGTQVSQAVQTAGPTLRAVGTEVGQAVQTAKPTVEAGATQAAGVLKRVVQSLPALQNLGITWEWQGTAAADGTVVEPADPSLYTLTFHLNGQVEIRADCNSVSATAREVGGRPSIVLGQTTLVACPPGSLDRQYLAGLASVQSAYLEGKGLVLETGAGTMRFAPAP
jgi:heat shock protein HslJ